MPFINISTDFSARDAIDILSRTMNETVLLSVLYLPFETISSNIAVGGILSIVNLISVLVSLIFSSEIESFAIVLSELLSALSLW